MTVNPKQTTPVAELSDEEFARKHCILTDPERLEPWCYPTAGTLSPRFLYRFLPIPHEPLPDPEYVMLRCADDLSLKDAEYWAYEVFISQWNTTWESGSVRAAMFEREVPARLRWVTESSANLRLISCSSRHHYDAYRLLYHLLPLETLKRFGLPVLHKGIWPQLTRDHLLDHFLPLDFDARLERAVTSHLWPLLGCRGKPGDFSKDDPIRMLSHNLNYWMPFIDIVAQRRTRENERTDFEDAQEEADFRARKSEMPPDVSLQTPLKGGPIWMGEDDADSATREMIEVADKHGQLRAILDAVRSNRIDDDFSEKWSYEREDFERKLYSKRSKLKVTFVELDDTIPVHGPNSETHDHLLWENFLAMLDAKERRIVICMKSGETKVGDIATKLGYKNHSPISKQLVRLRQKAKKFFDRL